MSQIPDGPPETSPAVTDPYEDYELPVEGFTGTAEEVERQWYEQCYLSRGDSIAQLTWRAVLMGSVLGGVLSLTNLYIGLKAGWGWPRPSAWGSPPSTRSRSGQSSSEVWWG